MQNQAIGESKLFQTPHDKPAATTSKAAQATRPLGALLERDLGAVVSLVNTGKIATAWDRCQQIDAAHPGQPAVQQMLAVLCMQRGDPQSASAYANRSLALRPDHIPTLIAAGDAARFSGAREESMLHYARASALQPDRADLGLTLGSVQHQCGQFQSALLTLERCVRQAPELVDAWFCLALVRQDLRDWDGAIAALKKLLKLSPDRVDALVNLGIVLQDAGRVEEAMRAYGRAYRLEEATFGRIANALAAGNTGRVWLNLDALRAALLGA